MSQRKEAIQLIRESQRVTFLTGAGVSVASGIPDYRSMGGVYEGIEEPEYLLSRSCLMEEPQKFYEFVKQLYHPEAQPNVIHQKMAELAQNRAVKIVTQNIDQLHDKAGSQVINFHGSLYDCYCMACGQTVTVEDYLTSDCHYKCGGHIRPNVVLYEENLDSAIIESAIQAVEAGDVLVIVGTSFKVYPFSDLLRFKGGSKVVVVNNEALSLAGDYLMITQDATGFFEEL